MEADRNCEVMALMQRRVPVLVWGLVMLLSFSYIPLMRSGIYTWEHEVKMLTRE